jgi:glycosyltransferase involved in cell wall biosynthesis
LNSPVITVITPTKNRVALLIETMNSVQQQTWPHWEHLIVDDGSTDGTLDEIRRRAASDDRVRLVIREGAASGANVCRNLGTRESRGRYLVFLDSDDLLAPDCLGLRAQVMDRNTDLDFAAFRSLDFERVPGDLLRPTDKQLSGDDLFRFMLLEIPWGTTGPVWRKTSLIDLGGFDESLPGWQDVELHIRAICAGAKYQRFSKVDYYYRCVFEAANVTTEMRRSPKRLLAVMQTLVKVEALVVKGPGMDWSRRRALCNLYFSLSLFWLQQNNLWEGLRCWHRIRERNLGPTFLFLCGVFFLTLLYLWPRPVGFGGKVALWLTLRWKGWARMRSNPKILK